MVSLSALGITDFDGVICPLRPLPHLIRKVCYVGFYVSKCITGDNFMKGFRLIGHSYQQLS